MKDKAIWIIFAIIIVVGILSLYYISTSQNNNGPDGKGFIPVEVTFENNIRNITLPVGSITNITTTLTSNLDIKSTITLNSSFDALGDLDLFSVELESNVLDLEPFGSNSTILTISISEETPLNIQPDRLLLEISSLDYPSVSLWDGVLEIYVGS